MPLEVGSRIAHYDVTALIGEGGMGQVYQATDTKLNRQVALKILPEAFATDPDRLARFQREAQVLASLNHPGIAAIYGIEEQDDTRALVLELVEGPTLAERISKGPIPVDEALPIAKQIAEALEAAHEAGVIHRDLKPANIKVREDGTVKVLDFGLAKALDPSPTSDPAESPTLTAAATQMGVIMGTAAYMSPEQAKGKVVDKRADVWAFGVVLFEMLAGQKPFMGDDVSTTLARVIEREPEWSAIPGDVPPVLDTFLRRCLAKAPGQRVHDVADMRLAIEGAFEPLSFQTDGLDPPVPMHLWQRPVPAATAALMLIAVTSLVWNLIVSSPAVTTEIGAPTHLPLATPPGVSLTYNLHAPTVAISPNGRRIVYVGSSQGRRLYLQDLDRSEGVIALAGTEGASSPFFAGDGEQIGFIANGQLKRVILGGGAPVAVAEVDFFVGGAWSPDNDMIYFVPSMGGVWSVTASGERQRVTEPDFDNSDWGHWWPNVLPGGERLIYTSIPQNRIMVFDLADGQSVPLLEGFFFARYVSTGHLILAQGTALFAAPFDPETLEVGTPVKILDGIVTGRNLHAEYSVSRSGTLAYLSGTSDFERTLVTVNRAGEVQQLDDDAYPDLGKVSFSPDGSRLALTMFQGPGMDPTSDFSQQHVFVYDLARGGFDRITVEPGFWPVWTPDGRSVVFSSMRNGQIDIYSRPADRGGPSELLYASEYNEWPSSWSRDGELAFQQQHPVTRHDVWIYSAESGQAHAFRSGPADERDPAFSPDGRWLAYQAGEPGQWEIYVTPYPGPGPDCRVSIAGGDEPHWSNDGTELFYRQGSTAMVADVSDQDFCRAESTPLFEGLEERIWDVSPADNVVVTVAPREPPTLHLVQNWFDELTRLVPTN